MKQDITKSQFMDAFRNAGRGNQFSYDGKSALYDYLESVTDDTGQEYDLDVIALCVEFTQYANLEELQQNYSDIEDMDDLKDHTLVIPVNDNAFIIQDY